MNAGNVEKIKLYMAEQAAQNWIWPIQTTKMCLIHRFLLIPFLHSVMLIQGIPDMLQVSTSSEYLFVFNYKKMFPSVSRNPDNQTQLSFHFTLIAKKKKKS